MMMKRETPILRVLLFLLVVIVAAHGHRVARVTQKINGSKRNILYSSRHLDGECLPVCLPGYVPRSIGQAPTPILSNVTTAPTKSPTPSPTKSPTPSPTKSPTPSPTKNPTPSPTKNPTPSPTKNPTPSPTNCPYYQLNFNDLQAGTYLHNEYWDTWGIKVTAIKAGNKGFTPLPPNYNTHTASGGGVMVFDTARPVGSAALGCSSTDGDCDLGAPNEACPGGGPGKGPGGKPFLADGVTPNPYANCEPLGNVLIIQESKKACPDDTATGGWIQFDFKAPAHVELAKLLDIDEGNTPIITVTDGNGATKDFVTKATGDNGLYTEPIDHDNVTRISIRYFGSGSIAELRYTVCPP